MWVTSLCSLEDCVPGQLPFHETIGNFVYFPAAMWKTTTQTRVQSADTGHGEQHVHVAATESELIMLDGAGCVMKALVLRAKASPDGRLAAATHVVTLELGSIMPMSQTNIMRPGTEKISLNLLHPRLQVFSKRINSCFTPRSQI